MCGIIGYCSTDRSISPTDFERMRDTMVHRGPDGHGSYYDQDERVALGHRRLSIIDLSENSAQPMIAADDRAVITFNGEIYNYLDLKKELSDKYTFKSTGDTEVLLYGYLEWGIEELLKRVNGMFAIGIYDKIRNVLILARDRVGIKPLYYHLGDSSITFSSELKGIVAKPGFDKEISSEGIRSYFLFRYIISPYTIYKDCYKLEPAHYATFDIKSAEFKTTKYWYPRLNSKLEDLSEEDLIKHLDESLNSAVERRALAADVPVHTFLSGGIDSSLITALLKKHVNKLHAYSIEVVDEIKNEIKDAERAAKHLKVELKSAQLDPQRFDQLHQEVIKAYDEPLADTSNIPTYFLCQLTAKSVKVALSGDGGDELFYGYSWYPKYKEQFKEGSLQEYLKVCLNTLDKDQISNILPDFSSSEDPYEMFLSKLHSSNLNPENAHILDFHTFMVDDILTKVDIASMAHSLEVRVPFLDHLVVEDAHSVSSTRHFKDSELKYLLKKVASNYLPEETIYKKKQGFSVPSTNWVNVDYEYNIVEGYASQDKVWDRNAIAKMLGGKLHEEKKWLLYNFERWYAINFHNSQKPLKPGLVYRVKRRLGL